MILTPMRRYGAMILMLLTIAFSGEVLAKTHATQTSQKSHITEKSYKQVSSKQEYSRNSAKSSSLPDLRKYPSGTPRKKAFLRTVMPYITSQNAAITADRNWLISKQYQNRWSPSE
ncbi:protein bax, partial [Salmonella enterica subsp. enterica serovar Montevideo]|nr:protein bax [Salmonella enterica subsp. enterica serovar Montevideo]